MKTQSIYDKFVVAGCDIDHHESDLYVKDTPAARKILREYENSTLRYSSFVSQKDGCLWHELPFMYVPFWAAINP